MAEDAKEFKKEYSEESFWEKLKNFALKAEGYVENYESVRDAVEGLTRHFQHYNRERNHESLGYWTPHEVYFGGNNNHDDGDACRLIHQIQPIFLF